VNANRLQSPPVTSSHLSDLLATFRELREEGRTVMARLRESMYEMQTQRDRLRRERTGRAPPEPTPARAAAASHLQVEYGMTPREVEVAMLIAEGCSNSIVARRLGISPHTARHHTQRVLGKLGVHSRAEAGARLRR
jgi:DNA-binding NarL/FixJ family response regulator